MRKVLSWILALVMCLSLLPMGAWASEEPEEVVAFEEAVEEEIAETEEPEEIELDEEAETTDVPEEMITDSEITLDSTEEELVEDVEDEMRLDEVIIEDAASVFSETQIVTDELVPSLDGATTLPSSLYLTQQTSITCTLASAAMMLRARMYLSGNDSWSSITESGIRSTAWLEGSGLYYNWTYTYNGSRMTVNHAFVSGMTISSLKSLLNQHPEGIVIYVTSIPHAVLITDYDGDTFYAADPANSNVKGRRTLASTWLASKIGNQSQILSAVKEYWYISSYSIASTAPKYYLDLNGYLDGSDSGNIAGYGTVDVYINGSRVADDVTDYYVQWPTGTTYEIKDIKANDGYTYKGVKEGSLKGTIGTSKINARLEFITEKYNITYRNIFGGVFSTDSVGYGNYKLSANYPTAVNAYFSGWAYTENAKTFDVRPGDTIKVSGNTNLYPIYITKDQATSGSAVLIYNIDDFQENGYVITETVSSVDKTTSESSWGAWSSWSRTPVSASDTVQVETTALYRYYYFYCPKCGRHEPFQGKSDCGNYTLTASDWHETWSTIPYSQCSPQSFSYTTAKKYTTSLGDGQTWCFSAGNQNNTAIGTIDATGDAAVIQTGYRSRKLNSTTKTETSTYTAYIIEIATPNTYTITYNANGGIGAPSAQTKTHGANLTLSSAKPTRSDYEFLGWATSASAASAQYQPGASFITDADTTLYAVWKWTPVEVPFGSPYLTVSNGNAKPGDNVTVTVSLANNPGIAFLNFKVEFDTSKLELVEAADGGLTGWTASAGTGNAAVWASEKDSTYNGEILKLTFKVLPTAAKGDTQITLTAISAFNASEKDVSLTVVSGRISISDRIPGDVNDDGKVDGRDLIRIKQYFAGYSVTINSSNADVTGNGTVDGRDVIRLAQYFAGYNVELQ